MAKKALQHVLEQTIGKYVRNLDAESLNVAVWSGKIELHSLELDVAAVNMELDRKAAEAPNLALPFKVISGKFESLKIEVPWAKLTSQSVVLRARGLTVDVEPYSRSQSDQISTQTTVSLSKLKRKRAKAIKNHDKYRQQAFAVRKLALAESDGNQTSFSSRLVRRIIENIQIEISDVHISLSDDEGAAGVILESLSLITTDDEGRRSFVDRTAGKKNPGHLFLHKMLEIKGFGVYLDENEFHETLPSIEENLNMLSKNAVSHTYVLAPLSFQAKLRQADDKICVDYSKYQLSSELSALSIMLSRNQLDVARKFSKQISSQYSAIVPLFPEYRPLQRVSKENAREWWKYAFRCIGRLSGRSSWVEFFRAFKKRKAYIPLYKRHAHHSTCSWIRDLSSEELSQLIEIEEDRSISIEGLMSWRDVADAQVFREREKEEAQRARESNIFSSIFSSGKVASDEDSPPINLTKEEIQELESMSRESFAHDELSKDAKLCDASFVLNALQISLTSYNKRQLAFLDMGKVSLDFKAATNGAYDFNFDLFDLEIQDRATVSSLFPRVLRSVKIDSVKNEESAFALNLSKTKSGDQSLQVKLAAFEAVASQVFFKELRRFASDSPTRASSKGNPILAQSLSGSVDLFYDADAGAMKDSIGEIASITQTKASSDFSSAFFDAWKEKAKTEVSWILDVDVKAPIVIIPESCNDPSANILILDLGHFEMNYGNALPTKKVRHWFEQNPNDNQFESSFDKGTLAMNDLTFKVSTTKQWLNALKAPVWKSREDDSAVIEPISITLDFGIETSSPEDPPRICCIGVIPSISFRLSPSHGSKAFLVIRAWTAVLEEMIDDPSNVADVAEDIFSPTKKSKQQANNASDIPRDSLTTKIVKADNEYPATFFFQIGLQRLSATLTRDPNDKLEAHLVSVYASTLIRSNGSSVSSLQMGWFWILDMIQGAFPRRQRLLAHSKLPQMPETSLESKRYDILERLTEQGVFKQDYRGSNELADIMYQENVSKIGGEDANRPQSILDASFSTLFIHWNPHAMKGVSMMISSFTSAMDVHGDSDTFILTAEKVLTPRSGVLPFGEDKKEIGDDSPEKGRLLINAKMESLDIYLQSARDDYPLFVLTVSQAEIGILQCPEEEERMECLLKLGDLRVTTPGDMGRTLPSYRTLLGLAPSQSKSLLTVRYYHGHGAIDSLDVKSSRGNNVEVYADFELSPMCAFYIQSQVMALVEYISEGILGVLFAQAASSAAEVALDYAASVGGETIFIVRATSFDLILPQAAYKEEFFSVHSGLLDVAYHMYPGVEGNEVKIELSDVSLKDRMGELMQEEPIRLFVVVVIPSLEVGGIEEQAMRIDIDISEASFKLTKSQYAQILKLLDNNFGDIELFLREEETTRSAISESPTDEPLLSRDVTHAGNKVIDILRRNYMTVKIKTLGLQLFGSDLKDPIAALDAVNANIGLNFNSDNDELVCQVALQNVVCEDRRFIASQRQYRHLIDQGNTDGDRSNSLFLLEYIADTNHSSLDIRIGSPKVVIIPDAISEVLSFFQVEQESTVTEVASPSTEERVVSPEQQDLHVDPIKGGDPVEGNVPSASENYMITYSVKTKVCSIVLVDLGSQLRYAPNDESKDYKSQNSQLTETIVLQGIFDAKLSMASDPISFETNEAEFQAHSDAMEIFSAFGIDMLSPLQILEPSQAAAHGSLKIDTEGASVIEIRAAATTPLEWSLSMHNAALLSAISSSLSELFATRSEQSGDLLDKLNDQELSSLEALRIQQLASALESTEREGSLRQNSSIISNVEDSSSFSTRSVDTQALRKKIQLKITMPEMNVTVINDLQGLDEALFRLSVITFVAGGKVHLPSSSESPSRMLVDFYLNTSILADYFDSSVNLWSKLLVMPWEITLKVTRAPSRRFTSQRLSSSFDLESFPCHISLSEKFLASLASANRMWSIYSMATNVSSYNGNNESGDYLNSDSIKHRMAATAARSLVTSLPYAVENHCGYPISFSLPGKTLDSCPCPNGSIKYFRFQPPQGSGYGGKRLYGQDIKFEKSITLFLDSTAITIPHLDTIVSHPYQAHNISDGRVLLTYVVKEGKTTVSQKCISFLHSLLHSSLNLLPPDYRCFTLQAMSPFKTILQSHLPYQLNKGKR